MAGNTFTYRAFGLTLSSAFALPDLLPATAAADVQIRCGGVPPALESPALCKVFYQVRDNEWLLNTERIAGARFLVRDGNEVLIEQKEAHEDDVVRLFLLGSCMGALLFQRGVLPLHGNAVATDGGAVDGGRLAITSEARLDNRDELCDRFDIPAAERPITPDGDLILEAYRRWSEDCPQHLFGDWSFAIWNPAERRLFLARDHHGVTALYYADTPRFFAFASSQKALLALPQVPARLNELKFAQRLVHWEGDPEQTLFQGIQHLLPAHVLAVTPQTSEKRRYWRSSATSARPHWQTVVCPTWPRPWLAGSLSPQQPCVPRNW